MRLFFHNRLEAIPGHKGTHVEFQGWQAHDQEIRGRSWVVIQYVGSASHSGVTIGLPAYAVGTAISALHRKGLQQQQILCFRSKSYGRMICQFSWQERWT